MLPTVEQLLAGIGAVSGGDVPTRATISEYTLYELFPEATVDALETLWSKGVQSHEGSEFRVFEIREEPAVDDTMDDVYADLQQRVEDVTEMYGEYASLYEAFSVLLEEVGELGQEIYARERNIGRIRAEATDCTVVLLRLLREWPLVREGVIEAVRVGV